MSCTLVYECGTFTFHLAGQIDDDDFERMEDGFERALGQPHPALVFDFSGLERMTASVAALIRVLKLQAQREGAAVELRNLRPEFRSALTDPRDGSASP